MSGGQKIGVLLEAEMVNGGDSRPSLSTSIEACAAAHSGPKRRCGVVWRR